MALSRGRVAVKYREDRGPRKRVRYTPVERADDDSVFYRTTEEWSGCGWRVTGRELVHDVSLEVDAAPVTTEVGP